ncbi:MAG: LAGLIDADG family homing endonuclease [Neptuniibacter sp.]
MADIVKRPWTAEEEQQLTEMYAVEVDTRIIAKRMGRSRRSIRGKAHCLGLSHKTRNDYLYTPNEDAFLVENAATMTRAEIGKAIGRSEGSVSRRGERLGVVFADPSKNAIYTKNMMFFNIPSGVNAYIAGWLASDGWIRPKSNRKPINQVGISVARKDRHILEYIRSATEYSGVIRDYAIDGYPQSEMRISGVPQWLDDLEKNWSLVPNKTKILRPPNLELLSEVQVLAYMVGLIEGDGNIRISNNTLCVSFVTASKGFADWVVQFWSGFVKGTPSEYKHGFSDAYYVNVYGEMLGIFVELS